MKYIQSGILMDILKKLGSFLGSLFEYASEKYPNAIRNIKVNKDGNITFDAVFGGGTVVRGKLTLKDDKKHLYHAYIEPIDGPGKKNRAKPYNKDVEYSSGKKSALIDMLTQYGNDFLNGEALETEEEELPDVDSSKRLNVKLHKVTASDNSYDLSIKKMVGTKSSVALPSMKITSNIIESGFFDDYADGDIYVSLIDNDDEILVEDIPEAAMGEFCLDREILHLISKAYAVQICLQAIQFSATGENVAEIGSSCSSYVNSTNYAISLLSQLYMRTYPCCPVSICEIIDSVNMECGYDLPSPLNYKEALTIVVNIMDDFVASLEILSYNLESYDKQDIVYCIRDIKNVLSYEHRVLGF